MATESPRGAGLLATDEFDDLTTDEIEHLVSRLTFTRFKKGDALLDNFARSEMVVFVVAGSVDVVSEGRRLHTRAAGELVYDLRYFDGAAAPRRGGASAGVLAC